MPLQQFFGTIETPQGECGAMLCADEDSPRDMVLYWTPQGSPARGISTRANAEPDGIELVPLWPYRALSNGAVVPAVGSLTDEEAAWIAGVRARLRRTERGYEGEWTGPDQARGGITLLIPPEPRRRVQQPERCQTWGAFKEWANRQSTSNNALWFRGHGSNTYSLRTRLHREGRSRLERYFANELLQFRQHAEAVFNRRFDFNDGDDYATLIALAQHHGLPTPMLDWTDSPYIAAFFAFSEALDSSGARTEPDRHVRVYTISRQFIQATTPPQVVLAWPTPFVAPLSVSPLHNPRLQAQQGRFVVTNVADVEGFICDAEERIHQRVLFAADMPMSCAPEALRDLAFMGLTAATMFPGLDGVGRMIRHEMFFKKPS